jgi:hypothetical protein
LPIGVIVFAGPGIVENLAVKARMREVPAGRFAKPGA